MDDDVRAKLLFDFCKFIEEKEDLWFQLVEAIGETRAKHLILGTMVVEGTRFDAVEKVLVADLEGGLDDAE